MARSWHCCFWQPAQPVFLWALPFHKRGPVILAVIEGELVEETPSGRNILRSGQVFWCPARETHNVKNISDKPARVLAIHFDPAQ